MLHSDVSDGDSIDKIARYFHYARNVNAMELETVQDVWDSRGWKIEEEDEFRHFGIKLSSMNLRPWDPPLHLSVKHGPGVFLQFRDGKLVNHQSKDYADPEALIRLYQNLQIQ